MRNLAIIPARGGSKRIPRKNIKDFLGKPIIAYSIEKALQSGSFDVVMVSTDDDEIASTALKYGATVPFRRSKENSDDFAGTDDVILEVLREYENAGQVFDLACCIYPTAPFVTVANLEKAKQKMLAGSFDIVMPVLRFSYPILRSLKVVDDKIKMAWPENENKRSQDCGVFFHDAGQFYWISVDTFLNTKKLFTDNTACIELDEMEVQDIDNLSDWKLAEYKFNHLHYHNENG